MLGSVAAKTCDDYKDGTRSLTVAEGMEGHCSFLKRHRRNK